MKPTFLLQLLLTALLISGCAHQQKLPQVDQTELGQAWSQHQTQVIAIDVWQAQGKLGIKVPNDGGSANLRWQQQAEGYQIDLNGPFGSGKLNITGTPNKVTLTEAGQPPQTAKTAEELILKNTGWKIPVAQLAYWVRGLPDPNTKITRLTPNPQGLLGELEQLGWKVTYVEYVNTPLATSTLLMPARVIAEYQDVKLTLVIREWSLNPPTTVK